MNRWLTQIDNKKEQHQATTVSVFVEGSFHFLI